MTTRTVTLGWILLLGLTLAVAVLHSGCAKPIPPCANPTAAYSGAWCASGVRDGKDFLFCTPSKGLCQYAVDRANAFNGVAKLGIEKLSECTRGDVTLVVEKAEK